MGESDRKREKSERELACTQVGLAEGGGRGWWKWEVSQGDMTWNRIMTESRL